jgi:hypothetical protein
LPNFALWDQGGAQARRAAPLPGPAARPSRGAGRPGNESMGSSEEDPWLGFSRPALTDRHTSSLAARTHAHPLWIAFVQRRRGVHVVQSVQTK